MEQIISVEFDEIEENQLYIDVANKVFQKCFEIENLLDKNLYINKDGKVVDYSEVEKDNKLYPETIKDYKIVDYGYGCPYYIK